jgi:hypothetical protein
MIKCEGCYIEDANFVYEFKTILKSPEKSFPVKIFLCELCLGWILHKKLRMMTRKKGEMKA